MKTNGIASGFEQARTSYFRGRERGDFGPKKAPERVEIAINGKPFIADLDNFGNIVAYHPIMVERKNTGTSGRVRKTLAGAIACGLGAFMLIDLGVNIGNNVKATAEYVFTAGNSDNFGIDLDPRDIYKEIVEKIYGKQQVAVDNSNPSKVKNSAGDSGNGSK